MEILVERKAFADGYTEGNMFVDGLYFCDTLEDKFRASGEKIPGETSIPAGGYDLKLTNSTRFGKIMPEILNVPGFSGIRIHAGNTVKDTDGCILVGEKYTAGTLRNSRDTYERLLTVINHAITLKGETVKITIR